MLCGKANFFFKECESFLSLNAVSTVGFAGDLILRLFLSFGLKCGVPLETKVVVYITQCDGFGTFF